MKVFICWSGERSKAVAGLLQQWLPTVLEGIEPTYSPDIPKGARWYDAISRELSQSRAGVVCLTPENLTSDWMHFEAGALFREAKTIFTFLFQVQANELGGPLNHLQSTEATRGDTKKLIAAMADVIARDISKRPAWEEKFEKEWPVLEERLRNVKPLQVREVFPSLNKLFERKTYDEPLDRCENQKWQDRYDGARETLYQLRQWEEKVHRCVAPYVSDYYEELVKEVDGYSMALGAHLLEERKFPEREAGKFVIEPAVLRPCEERRRNILRLLNHLNDQRGAPILDDSRYYRSLDRIEDKKDKLIHPFEKRIKEGEVFPGIVAGGLVSPWDFDRIVYYLVQEHRADMGSLIECVTTELEKVRAREQEGSLIPLHYAIRALEHGIRKIREGTVLSEAIEADVQRVAKKVETYLQGDPSRDAGGHIQENLKALRDAYESSSSRGKKTR